MYRTLPQSPSVTAPSRKEPLTQSHSSLIFISFLLIGKPFIEPRHYGGVFVLQKQGDANGVPKENILSSAAAGKDKDGDNYDPNAIIIVKKVAETVIHKRSIPPPKRQII